MPKRNRGAFLRWRKDREQWVIIWYANGSQRSQSTVSGNQPPH